MLYVIICLLTVSNTDKHNYTIKFCGRISFGVFYKTTINAGVTPAFMYFQFQIFVDMLVISYS